MTESAPTYRARFISAQIERAPIGTRGLFVERAGNTVSVCAKTGAGIEVILVLSPEEAEALGNFLQGELRALLAGVVAELSSRDHGTGNAPGHGHAVPGVWDSDNGAKAGKPCAWCALWAKIKAVG